MNKRRKEREKNTQGREGGRMERKRGTRSGSRSRNIKET